ncbi:beta strand repeat-containing protein [Telmatobacter bradus]|uniref:beta strand repeat-containing protein n=1 Tax=Telmatobacter bradus TaxID=474953 RepID=UPI003B436F9F
MARWGTTLIMLAGMSMLAASAETTTYTVTLHTDTVPTETTSTSSNYNLPGLGTGAIGDLRYGIQQAIQNGGEQVIDFNCGSSCKITLSAPLPPITSGSTNPLYLTINGGSNGSIIIDGASLYRVFFVDSGTVILSDLVIQNGLAQGGAGGSVTVGTYSFNGGSGGGGFGAGGGLFINQSTAVVSVRNTTFKNCTAIGGSGGAVEVDGTLAGAVLGGGGGGGGGMAFAGGDSIQADVFSGGGGGMLAAGGSGYGAYDGTNLSLELTALSYSGNGGAGGGGGGAAGEAAGTAYFDYTFYSAGTGGVVYGDAVNGAGAAGTAVALEVVGAIAVGGAGGFGGGGGGGRWGFDGVLWDGTADVNSCPSQKYDCGGGAGGFGGGGGGGAGGGGGSGGFGGGAGGYILTPDKTGTGGGYTDGTNSLYGGNSGLPYYTFDSSASDYLSPSFGSAGGGGAAAGPAIFVNEGSLSIFNSNSIYASATAGAGGINYIYNHGFSHDSGQVYVPASAVVGATGDVDATPLYNYKGTINCSSSTAFGPHSELTDADYSASTSSYSLSISSVPTTVTAGSSNSITVQLLDGTTLVAGYTGIVTLTSTNGKFTYTSPLLLTCGTGTTTFNMNEAGSGYTITAVASDSDSVTIASATSAAIEVDPGAAYSLTASSGASQSAVVNQSFASNIEVLVSDEYSNPVPGVAVNFSVPASGASATLSSASATTNSSGIASVTATAGTASGTYDVTAGVTGLTSVTFALTNTFGSAANLAIVSGTPQSAVIGNAFTLPLKVKVTDAYGNVVSGTTVAFAAPSSGASATFQSADKTGSDGITSVTATANLTASANSYAVTSNLNPNTSVTFSLTNTQATPTVTATTTSSSASYGTNLKFTGTASSTTATGMITFKAGSTVLSTCTLSNGACSIWYSTLAVGSYTITASYDGDDNYVSADGTVAQVITQATPTLAISAPSSVIYGGSYTPTITYSGDGTVSLAGTSSICTVTGSVSSYTVSYVGVGSCTLTASATAGTNYASVSSVKRTFNITQAPPALAVSAPSSATYGGSYTPTITYSGDGTVSLAGTSSICTVTGSGTSYTVSYIGVGGCTLTASATAGTDYAAVSNVTQSFTIGKATPALAVSAPSSATYGGSYTPTVIYNGDGTVSLSGTTGICTVTGSGTSYTVSYISVGGCTLTASATAGTDYAAVSNVTQSFTIGKATPALAVSAPSSATYGGSYTPTIAYSGDGAVSLSGTSGICAVTGSGSNYTVSYEGAGNCTLTASATAGTDYAAVSNVTQSFSIGQTTPTVTASTSSSSATYGANLTITGTASSSTATGTITFKAGSTTLGSCTLSSRTCSIIYSALAVGSYSITASYGGDSNYASANGTVDQIITQATLMITANSSTRNYGAANPAFTGAITGTLNDDSFTQSFSTTATTLSNVGTYAIVPSLSGTNLSDYSASIVDGVLTVTQAGTTTTLSASDTTTDSGTTTALTAQVVSTTSGTPTGTVSFYSDTTLLGSSTLSNGSASYTTTLAAGSTYSLKAVYSGDTNFTTSTFSDLSITEGSLDFTITTPTTTTQTVVPGSAVSYSFSISPNSGSYAGTVTFTASGLPTGATVAFSPATISATAGAQTVTMTIQTAAATAQLTESGRKLAPLVLALLLFPLLGAKKMRRQGRYWLCFVILLGGIAASAALTGCGGSYFAHSAKDYTVTVTATGGGLQHSFTVTLNVQ